MVALVDYLCRELDRENMILLVLLGPLVAFNTISHSILLSQVLVLGLGCTALRWFESYPEGLVLEGDAGGFLLCSMAIDLWASSHPPCYNIYMKLLREVIERFGLQHH